MIDIYANVKKKITRFSYLRRAKVFWEEYKRQKINVLGLSIVLAVALVALLAPLLSPYNPSQKSYDVLSPPSLNHLMGTDDLGRDIFSRIIFGSRISLLFGICAGLVSGILGMIAGAIAGYFGRLIDDLLSRLFEIILMIPMFILLILVVATVGANVFLSMVIVGGLLWPHNARIMRGQVLTLKSRDFVLAARMVGASDLSILFRHIVPNGLAPVLANITLQMGWAVLTEAGLNFLGLGDPNYASWGQILYWGRLHTLSAWWMIFFSGLVITILVLGFILLGDGINVTVNPRLRERR